MRKKIEVSEEKFSNCRREEKNVSVEFRVFGKKKELKEKFGFVRKRKSKCFRMKLKWANWKVKVKITVGNKNDCGCRARA